MAAGLTIEPNRYDEFSARFRDALTLAKEKVGELDHSIFSDGALERDQMTLDYADFLRNAAPWGQGFPSPVFDDVFKVLEYRVVGGQHLKFVVENARSDRFDAIAFKAIEPGAEPNVTKSIHMAFQMDVNEFRGQRSLQLIVEGFGAP